MDANKRCEVASLPQQMLANTWCALASPNLLGREWGFRESNKYISLGGVLEDKESMGR